MNKRILYTLFSFIFMNGLLWADQGGANGNDYMWTDQDPAPGPFINGLYDWVDAKDGTAVITYFTTEDLDKQISNRVALPANFNFRFYGQLQDSLFISANGYVTFDDPGVGAQNPSQDPDPYETSVALPSASAPDSLIAVYWNDLEGQQTKSAQIYVKTVGSAPNRQYIIQWVLPNNNDNLEFQIILYETTNKVKFQYNKLFLAAGTDPGTNVSVGIQATSANALQYSFNQTNRIFEYSAILWHGEEVNSAEASISPTTSTVDKFETFTYTVKNFDPSDTERLGKADSMSIKMPFTGDPTVTGIKINGTDAIIQNSTTLPTETGYATWHMNNDSLIVRTNVFEVVDSINITFFQQMDGTVSSNNAYASTVSAEFDNKNDKTAATDDGWSVDVTAAPQEVDYYTFSPATGQTVTAGNTLQFTVTARDKNGIAVANSDSVIFSVSGSSTASLSPTNGRLAFAGGSTVTIDVSDNIAGSFTLKAEAKDDASITGTSPLVTVEPAAVNSISVLSSNANITAGSERNLRVALLDQFGNRLGAGNTVTFTRTLGTGSFNSAVSTTDDTDALGEAQALFTASTTSGGTDRVNVSIGAVSQNIDLVVDADNLSYYTLTPSGSISIAAGVAQAFTLTAKDQFGNDKTNNGTVLLQAQGSATAQFSAGPYTFANSSTLAFTVSDETAGSFTVVATNSVDNTLTGQSGLVTVNAAAPSVISILSSQDSIVAGTSRILQVALEDVYGNRQGAAQDITFTRFNGSGLFDNGTNTITVATDGQGVADTNYTASSTVAGSDSIEVVFSATVRDTIVLPLKNGVLAELRIQTVAGNGGAEFINDVSITADQTLTVFAEGYDASGNYLGPVSADWSGSGVVTGNLSATTAATSTQFTAVATGTGKITAIENGGSIDDISAVITVTPGATTVVRIMDEPNGGGTEITTESLAVGNSLNLFANGFDADNNFTQDVNVDWATTGGLQNSDLSQTTASSSTVLTPTAAGTGTVTTSSAFTDDATGNITVSVGALAALEIRTASANGGVVLNDSSFSAGASITLFAAGYDAQGNYIADQTVTWSVEGDAIGSFSNGAASATNTFTAETVNNARLKIISGSITDYSGIIKVSAGTPTAILATSPTTLSGAAGSTLTDSLAVRLTDAFGNVVPNTVVNWTTPSSADGGVLTPGGSPAGATNSSGVSRSKWRLRNSSSAGTDTAFASFAALTPVEFVATLNPSTADNIGLISGNGQSGTVGSDLAAPFVVRVEDSGGSPVSGISVSFSITSTPNGATSAALSTQSVLTDASGLAQTTLTLGDLAGSYTVAATNAQLLGSPITFTSTANAAAFDHLEIFAGNSQTDTVGQTLPFKLMVKAVDAFNNPIQGLTINWQTPSDGSVDNLSQTVTDLSGIDTVSWTLRTSLNTDTLTATSGASTVTFTAQTVADAFFALNSVSGNNSVTVAGASQKIEARAVDQYGNNVQGEQVSFSPLNSMTALNSTSDENGLVSAVYRTPANNDSSTATITSNSNGSEVASYKVYGLRYVENSLSPKSVATGETHGFTVQVNNPGASAVSLNAASTTFSIEEGAVNTTATLSGPTTIAANGTTTLTFNDAVVAAGFSSGSYTPEITLIGSGLNAAMNGSFFTGPGELVISPLEIDFVVIPVAQDTLVTVGNTISEIQMQVTNNSSAIIRNVVPTLVTSPVDIAEMLIAGQPDSVLPNSSYVYKFSMAVPSGSSLGKYSIDGAVVGSHSGSSASDSNADQVETFTVVESASFEWVSYAPGQVSEGQNSAFTAYVKNNGAYDVTLDKNTTTLTFGTDVFSLSANQTLEANGATTKLDFTAANLTITSGSYAGTLVLNGNEVGNPVNTSITTMAAGLSPLAVQTIAVLAYTDQTLSAANVSQGEKNEALTFTVQNSGEATARILSKSDVLVRVDGADISSVPDYTATLTSHTDNQFPINIAAGASVTLSYRIDIADNATAASDQFSSRITYADSNSTLNSTVSSAINPSWTVLTKSALIIRSLSAAATKVSQGQTGLNVQVVVENSGQATAQTDTVYLNFKRNINTFSDDIALPFNLLGGATQTVNFTVNVDNNAATGIDSIQAIVSGQNSLSNASTGQTSAYLDGWQVFSAPKLVINSVTSTESVVYPNQQNVPIKVTLSNEGQTTVNLDSLYLINSPDGFTADTRSTAIDSIQGGETKTFDFLSDISASANSDITLGAYVRGENAITSATIIESPGVTRDVLSLQSAADLVVDSVYADFKQFTQSQTGLKVRTHVRNSGSASIQLDETGLIITRTIPASNTPITFSRISPAVLPSLAAGQTVELVYELSTVATPADSGIINIDAFAYGTDNVVLVADSAKNALVTEEVEMQTAAKISVASIANPPNVSEGQQNIAVNVTIQNKGQATARVEALDLNFYNSANNSANSDYTRIKLTPPQLPLNLAAAQDTVLAFDVSIKENASHLGTINIGAQVQSTELNRNLAFTTKDSSASSWVVAGQSSIKIVSIATEPEQVSQGQGPIDIQLRIENTGSADAQIDSLDILHALGAENYTEGSTIPALPFNLSAGLDQVFTLQTNVNANATVGLDSLRLKVVATDSRSSNQSTFTDDRIYDLWSVQFRPDIVIDSVVVSPASASTGQTGLIASLYLQNSANSNRATAVVDSVNINFTLSSNPANDQFLFNRTATPTTPLVMQQGSSARFDFDLDVNSDASLGNYVVEGYVESRDLNDDAQSIENSATTPGNLAVVSAANLLVDAIWVEPDTISQNQTHGKIYVQVSNSGGAGISITSKSLSNDKNVDLQEVYLAPSTPFELAGGAIDTLEYAFTAPNNLAETVLISATVGGTDINSGSAVNASSTTPASLLVQTEASPSVVTTTPNTTTADSPVQFRVTVNNTGEAEIILNSNTRLVIEDTPFQIPLDAASPLVIVGETQTELIFQETLISGITQNRSYSLSLQLRGNTNQAAYSSNLNAGALAYGNSLVSINSIVIKDEKDIRFQGDTGLEVDMMISNTSGLLNIDSADTYLIFKDAESGVLRSVINLHRTDNIKTLDGSATLNFVFDLAETFPIGDVNIYGQLSLDNGNTVILSEPINVLDVLTVKSNAQISYLASSITPDSVVQSQKVSFKLSFINEGSASLDLDAEQSYIEFPGLTGTPRGALSANFTIGGLDTNEVSFNEITIPADATLNMQNVVWRLSGTMLNGDTHDTTSTVINAFEVIPGAQLTFNTIVIAADTVQLGQTAIQIDYAVNNSGASAALLDNLNSGFELSGNDVSAQWINTTNLSLPDTIAAGATENYRLLYNLKSDAQTGTVVPAPQLTYRDIRTAALSQNSNTVVNNDNVVVTEPADIRIDSLYFADVNTPNAPFVNNNQAFTLAVNLTNLGALNIASGQAVLKKGNATVESVEVGAISAGNNKTVTFSALSLSVLGEHVYTVSIENILDGDGLAVNVQQPLDNAETIFVQDARQLSINNGVISEPQTATDGEVSVGQFFTVKADIAQSGQSGYGSGTLQISLPANYVLANGETAIKGISAAQLTASWNVQAIAASTIENDTIKVAFATIPTDNNTGSAVSISNGFESRNILVQTIAGAAINITSFVKNAPLGARAIISTGQNFILHAQFSSNDAVSNPTATLILPSGNQGYAISDAATKAISGNNASWSIFAPANVSQSESIPDTFFVETKGMDKNTNSEVTTRSNALTLTLKKAAELSLSANISAPVGALDKTVSTQQIVTLSVNPQNLGSAQYDNSGSITLKAGGGILFEENGQPELIVNGFNTTTFTRNIVMPTDAGLGWVQAVIYNNNLPMDENSTQPVAVKVDSVRHALTIVERAELTLKMDKTGAAANTFKRATGQKMVLSASVNNAGIAHIDTTAGKHALSIDLTGSGVTLDTGENATKLFSLDSTVSWNLLAPSTEQLSNVKIMATPTKLPLDENDGLAAFRSNSSMRDSVDINFVTVQDINLSGSFADNAIVVNKTVAVNQQNIYVEATLQFDPQLDTGKGVNLIIPENSGFAVQEGNLISAIADTVFNKKVSWLLKAPDVSSPDPFIIKLHSYGSSTQGFSKEQDQDLQITVVPKARLSVVLSIDKPDGATDGIVSNRQAFRLKALISNRQGASPVVGTGRVQLALDDPTIFTLIDTTADGENITSDLEKEYQEGEAVCWWLRANTVTTSMSRFEVAALLKQQIAKLAAPVTGSNIKATITAVPNDAGLGVAADGLGDTYTQNVVVVTKASITLASSSAPAKVSTGQTFVYSVTADEIASNLVSPTARFILPDKFGGNSVEIPINPATKTASVTINVPTSYDGTGSETLQVRAFGTDQNTNAQSSTSNTLNATVQVEIQPKLVLKSKVVSPVSAQNNELSFGQEMQLKVWVEEADKTSALDYAAITGSGSIVVDDALLAPEIGFTLVGSTAEQNFSQLGEENGLVWNLKGPQKAITTNIKFKFGSLPKDANSNLDVALQNSESSHAIQVRAKEIVLKPVPGLVQSSSYVQGQQNVPLLAFEVSNKGYLDSLFVNSLTIGFHIAGDKVDENSLLPVSTIANMFKTLKVVNREHYEAITSKTSQAQEALNLASKNIDNTVENPVALDFNLVDSLTILPDTSEVLIVLADLEDNSINQSFRASLNGLTAFDVNETIKLKLVGENGDDFLSSDSSVSVVKSVTSSNPEKSFFTYPNPFGRGETEEERMAFFNFYIEKTSNVSVKIFTLVGDLVWSEEKSGITPGSYDRLFRWDGKNSNGREVLNGTYIGVLEVKAVNGPTKRYITKIAYIK